MTIDFVFRRATLADTETIADHRNLMFAEIGMDVDMLAENRTYFVPWLAERLGNGNYIGLLVECDQQVIAGAGLWVTVDAPLPSLLSSDFRRANIVNVYTNAEHRRKGLARQLMTKLIDIAREEGCPIVQLHASDAGRPLYESMGFANTNELRLTL